MLRQLLVKNFALIEHVEIAFSDGMHVMTGETGAGKSIVVDAVCLLLGERADREMIRSGCDKAYVEGLFELSDCKRAAQWLHKNDFDEEGSLIISRELNISGRSICRIQGTAVPLSQLKEISWMLMDIHGQHEHQSLLDDDNHLHSLDAYGDDCHKAIVNETRDKYLSYRELYSAFSRLKNQVRDRDERLMLLKEQEAELSAADLYEGEEEILAQKNTFFKSHEKISRALEEAKDAIYTGGSTAISEQARKAMHSLSCLEQMGEELASIYKRSETLFYDAEDLGMTIQNMIGSLEFDPIEAAQTEERLDLIRKLSRKYGSTAAAMLDKLDEIRKEIEDFEKMDDNLSELKKQAQNAYREYLSASSRLSSSRHILAERFSERMELQLSDLNMKGTHFVVSFEKDREIPSADGQDRIRFLIAPNIGEEPKPLTKIASGGELSRIMLAMKALLAENSEIPSMVFDEIDTGISGRTAQVVAQKMWDIARYRQVICVTHLQQIAAMATRHYLIQKIAEGSRTNTYVAELEGDSRTAEIERMLSGVTTGSESGRIHARHMLEEAAAYRQSQR